MHTHDDNPCWDAHCAPHLTHHDPAIRELIARAEARGAGRVLDALDGVALLWQRIAEGSASSAAAREGLSDAQELTDHSATMTRRADQIRAFIAEHRPGTTR